jgi:ornithine carbamoyltransferase
VLGKDLVSIADLSAEDLAQLLDLAVELKAGRACAERPLDGKILALVFQKPSLRTRVSFEVGMRHLGGSALYLSHQEVGLGERESIPDAARVLSRMVDGIVARTYFHRHVVELARGASVPVINGLSDDEHPCQILADLLTLRERFGRLEGLTLAYVGDANNVATSLLLALPRLGVNLVVASPAGYEPSPDLLARADAEGRAVAWVEVTRNPAAAVANAHAVYADSWYSMGQEHEAAKRRDVFRDYQVNEPLMARAPSHAVAMHCLPAHRGHEITDGVLDGPASVVWQQAGNRLHAQKAVLLMLLGV